MKQAIKQYRNLIALVAVIILVITVILSDPLGCIAKRHQEREAIYNQIAIDKAETDKRIAIIQAEKEAELIRIHQGLGTVMADDLVGIGMGETE